VDARQRDELEAIAHVAERLLELRDGAVVEVLLPVERWRAVVGQQFAGEARMDGIGKALRHRQIRR